MNLSDESKVELVSKGGHTYFKPVKESHINGLRKWEQAFRVYAAIYTRANPERSVEIWQYMHVINIAASTYQWSNVAYYDMTFRQLMAFNPNRSWAKTYNQGWNLALREPLGYKNPSQQITVSSDNSGDSNSNSRSSNRHSWRDDYCWKYNKNRCHKTICDFDHRCTYCGGWKHGFFNCRKRLNKVKQRDGRKHGNGGSSPKKQQHH